jgi:hypothetical protein
MKSSLAYFLGERRLGLACSIALLFGSASNVACTAVGSIGDTRAGASGGSGSTTGAGSGGTGGPQVLAPSAPVTDWYAAFQMASCSAPSTALPSSRIWRLSTAQWSNTVTAALGIPAPNVTVFPEDQVDPVTGFSDDSTGDKVTLPLASAYFDATDAASTAAAPGAITAFACLATAPIATTCGATFVAAYGQKLFRRPLTATEVTTFANYLNSESNLDPAPTAVTSVIKAMLLSPNFIYRTELGNSKPGPVDLTSDEIASLLSYTIADIPPDAQLQTAAAAGQLSAPATRSTQAERLAALPSAKNKLAQFWNQYLALGDQPTSPGVDLSMYNEATTFFSQVVFNNQGTLKELLTAPYTYGDATIAAVYGSNPDATGKITLDPTQRAGFLTSAAMLAQTSAPSQAATVIHRGLLVRERVLCETPPPPPPTVVPDPNQIQQGGPNATAKQNYAVFEMTHQSCNACHSFFQPLGLAFEAYDANGVFRTSYPAPISMPIDTTGTLSSAGEADGAYTDVVDMATKLGAAPITQYCFAQQFAEFAFGRPVSPVQEACTVKAMGDYVNAKGGQIQDLPASFAAVPTVYRRFHQ